MPCSPQHTLLWSLASMGLGIHNLLQRAPTRAWHFSQLSPYSLFWQPSSLRLLLSIFQNQGQSQDICLFLQENLPWWSRPSSFHNCFSIRAALHCIYLPRLSAYWDSSGRTFKYLKRKLVSVPIQFPPVFHISRNILSKNKPPLRTRHGAEDKAEDAWGLCFLYASY